MSKYSHLYKYITDKKIVGDNIIFPCIKEHIIPIRLLSYVDNSYHNIDCDVCRLLYCVTHVAPSCENNSSDEFHFEYYLGGIVHQYTIESIAYICIYKYRKNYNSTIHKIIYDNFYEYDLISRMYSFNKIKTNNYQMLKEYMITIFNNMLLPDICRIILDYILLKDDINKYKIY
jgi:hypothetical protein